MNRRGSALITIVVIALLFMAGITWYVRWGQIQSTTRVHRTMVRNATDFADEGINNALLRLKAPDLAQFLPINGTTSYALAIPNGRIDLALARQSTDTAVVTIKSTAWLFLSRGGWVDPVTNERAEMAEIEGTYRITNVGQFLIAIPSILPVSYGTNAPSGIIYASQLDFKPCLSGPCNTPTQLLSAFYYDSVTPNDAPAYVQFTAAPFRAQKVSYPMSFVGLDPSVRAYYSSLATQPLPPSFDGLVDEPNPAHVYYVTGDLHIAQNSPLTVRGVYIIYVTGNVYIHDNINLSNVSSWLGVLAEGDIHLADDAPNNLSINGTFMCNSYFKGDALPGNVNRSNVNLTINGGIVSMTNIDIATVWVGQRTYTYQVSADPHFILPNFSQTLEYKITHGKTR
jgi:hypothetical protein